MPLIDDRKQIQKILETDRTWAAYALADLEPKYFKFATWYSSADQTAICLLYRAFATRVVLCVGQQIDSLLREVDDALGDAQELYAVVRPDTLPVMKKYYRVVEETPMLRMVLDVNSYHSMHTTTRGDLAPATWLRFRSFTQRSHRISSFPKCFKTASIMVLSMRSN